MSHKMLVNLHFEKKKKKVHLFIWDPLITYSFYLHITALFSECLTSSCKTKLHEASSDLVCSLSFTQGYTTLSLASILWIWI